MPLVLFFFGVLFGCLFGCFVNGIRLVYIGDASFSRLFNILLFY